MRLVTTGAAMKVALGPNGFGPSHGRIAIYCAPKAVLQHVQWSISEVLARPVTLRWQPQPLAASCFQTELNWEGLIGTASKLVSTLMGWHYLTFELHETGGNGNDGSIYMFTPELGIFRGAIGPHGDLMVNENQIRRVLNENLRPADALDGIESLLGSKWDEALEPYRKISAGESDLDARLSV